MIVVTGANGFIGSAMVWELEKAGYSSVVAVDTISLQERNLLQGRSCKSFLLKDEIWDFLNDNKQNVEWVIHMGACSSTTETNWTFLSENNVSYSERIFEFCTKEKISLIYASSAATYGSGESGFSDNTDPNILSPLNLYGKSKLIVDQWVLKEKLVPPHWYGLRFFNVFGPHEYFKGPMASLVFKAYHQVKESGSLKLFRSHRPDYKDGHQLRDFIYVKDVTTWMVELIEKKPKSGIYNMGSGQANTWLDLAEGVFQSLGKKMSIDWIDIPESIRNQYQYFTQADMGKWQTQGLSRQKWNLRSAVEDYVCNYLEKSNSFLR